MKPERLKTVAPALVLFLLNLWLVRGLLSIEYLDEMGSIEGAYLAIARWAQANWGDLTWFPLWYGGIPFIHTYSPLLHRVVAAVSTLAGTSIGHTYHAVTAVFYSLGAVTLYWMALRLCRSRAYSFAAALLYSLVSTSTLLIPGVDTDAGGLWGLRRLQAMVGYGEGPHITGMTLLPLAIALLDIAFEKRRAHWWCLAVLSLAAVALTNWLGAASLAIAALAWLLSREEGLRWRNWLTAAAVGLSAYLIASPLIPPSLVRGIARNERYLSGELSALGLRLAVLAGGLLLVGAALWLFHRLRVPPGVRFSALFLLGTASITLGFEWFRVTLVPQPSRYHLEMEMGLALLAAFLAQMRLKNAGRGTVVALTAVLLASSLYATVRCEKRARSRIRPIEIESTIEYREAMWFDRNMNGHRVFAPGSIGFFLNAFTDTPQFAGGFNTGAVNPVWSHVNYQILSGDGAGEREGEFAVLWLKAYGVAAVAVSGPKSGEFFKPFRNPRKFDGLLAELWRDGDDVVYRLPRRSTSLAHVIRPGALPPRWPVNGIDMETVRPYVAALEDPTLPLAQMKWMNRHQAAVTARMETDQVLSVQMSYHPGWRATVGGEPRRVYGDNLGQMVIEPHCQGPCAVDLYWDGGLEMLLARIASWGCLLGGIALMVLQYLHQRR
jgi:hypothetical protein